MEKLTKIVNGRVIELTPEEQAEILAQWQAEDAKRAEYLAKEKYKDDRRKEYPTNEALLVALWEKVIENRPEAAESLQQARLTAKAKYPKPEIS